jgi:hypothetical protein
VDSGVWCRHCWGIGEVEITIGEFEMKLKRSGVPLVLAAPPLVAVFSGDVSRFCEKLGKVYEVAA